MSAYQPEESALSRELLDESLNESSNELSGKLLNEKSRESSNQSSDAQSLQAQHNARNFAQQIDVLRQRNHSLASALRKATDQLQEAKQAMVNLASPPLQQAIFVRVDSYETHGKATVALAEISLNRKHMVVAVSPEVDVQDMRMGQSVLLDEHMRIVRGGDFPATGKVMSVVQVLDGMRLLVSDSSGAQKVIVRRSADTVHVEIDVDDTVLVDDNGEFALQLLESSKAQELILEEYPDVSFEDIGGLDEHITVIRDALELPFKHKNLYDFYQLEGAKGVLLYGPPGNGKTLLAKAIAHSLSHNSYAPTLDNMSNVYSATGNQANFVPGAFLSVKGPEVLSKFVGEAERMIRHVFSRARELSEEGRPVVIFIDEMDSLLRSRGSGVSSDVETTVVPQFLAELDGIENLTRVVVIGASNRVDMIDPAVLRPGRLDIKIPISAPDSRSARDIMSRYIDDTMVEGGDVQALIDEAVRSMYETDRPIAELTFQSGYVRDVAMADLISGARLKNIVDRAKIKAIKQSLESLDSRSQDSESSAQLITSEFILQAVDEEYDDMYRMSAHTPLHQWPMILEVSGERVVSVSMAAL